MSRISPANWILTAPPTWWIRKVMPLSVPSVLRPYTSAVSEVVRGAVAQYENPAMAANPQRPHGSGASSKRA